MHGSLRLQQSCSVSHQLGRRDIGFSLHHLGLGQAGLGGRYRQRLAEVLVDVDVSDEHVFNIHTLVIRESYPIHNMLINEGFDVFLDFLSLLEQILKNMCANYALDGGKSEHLNSLGDV